MCIAGEDIWHLDCERYKAAAGIRTGKWRRKKRRKKMFTSCLLFSDSDASSEDSQSRSRTHSITTPSPTGACMSNMYILLSQSSCDLTVINCS